MAYSTDQDIYDRLGEDTVQRLTDDDSSGSVDTQVLADVRTKVFDRINVWLRRRYDLPIQDQGAQDVLAGLEVDILARRLYERRPTVEIPESVTVAAGDAWGLIKAISKGSADLGIDADGDGEEDGTTTLQVRGPDRQTMKEKMDSF